MILVVLLPLTMMVVRGTRDLRRQMEITKRITRSMTRHHQCVEIDGGV